MPQREQEDRLNKAAFRFNFSPQKTQRTRRKEILQEIHNGFPLSLRVRRV
jgi:hypothetical protein